MERRGGWLVDLEARIRRKGRHSLHRNRLILFLCKYIILFDSLVRRVPACHFFIGFIFYERILGVCLGWGFMTALLLDKIIIG